MDPAGCPEAPSAIRWASSTLQLGEWPRKVMRIRPSQLPLAVTRGADAGQPGLLFGGHGPSGEYDESYVNHHWESPCSHTGPKGNVGVWGASMPLEQEALFLGESCAHQKLSGSKARGAPAGLGRSSRVGHTLVERADPARSGRAECVGKPGRASEPQVLYPEGSQGVAGLSG